MYSRNLRDIATGLLLTALGTWFAVFSIVHYGRGTLARVGEGAFPAGAGVLLAFLGLLIFAGGWSSCASTTSRLRLKPPLFIILGTAAFALAIKPFGLVPAIFLVTIFSSFADLKVRFVGLLILCVVLSLLAYLVFVLGLGLLIPLFDWPL